MQYQVLSGKMTKAHGFQRVHFRSRSVDECYRFIFSRLASSDSKIRKEALGLYVEDQRGERYSIPKKIA